MGFKYFFFQERNVVSINNMCSIVFGLQEPIVQNSYSSVHWRLESDDAHFVITL